MLRADPIRLEAREIESRTFRPLSRLLAFLLELPLLHQQHVTVAAPWRPEGVPPTGVCRKAPATTSPGRVSALRAAHGRSPGGTKPARLGARRVCSWKAWPRCPSPYTPPQSAPWEESGPGAGSRDSASSPSRSKDWSFPVPSSTSSFCLPPATTRRFGVQLHLVTPKVRLFKSPQQGLTRVSVSLLGSGVRAPFPERIVKRRKPTEKKKERKKERRKRAKQQHQGPVGSDGGGAGGGREC